MTSPIRVVLVEDNEVFRGALELLFDLQPDIEVVSSQADGSEAVAICEQLSPDVVILDYRLPGLDGVEVTSAVRSACPDVAVVCLTASVNEREAAALIDAGALCLVRKDEPLDRIMGEIRRAAGRAGQVAD